MSPSGKNNPAASTRDRLLALAREQGEDFQLVLIRYGLERLLYRLSQAPHRDRFVLKGAMLFMLWNRNPHRPTRDVDLLGSGDSSKAGLHTVFRDLCAMPDQGDGVMFDPESVRVEPIRDDTEYGGMRVTLTGQLAGARIPIQADIGFGDTVTPETVVIEYPTILDDPAPTLKAYPRETVIAEKYQALVAVGMANSRMKDFYDLWVMARDFDYQGDTLAQAIGNTFARRHPDLPEHTPSGLSPDFSGDRQKNIQWKAFLSRQSIDGGEPTLPEVCQQVSKFLRPPTEAARRRVRFDASWKNGGPWSDTS